MDVDGGAGVKAEAASDAAMGPLAAAGPAQQGAAAAGAVATCMQVAAPSGVISSEGAAAGGGGGGAHAPKPYYGVALSGNALVAAVVESEGRATSDTAGKVSTSSKQLAPLSVCVG